MIGLKKPRLTPEEKEEIVRKAEQIYDDEKREAECLEYLHASVTSSIDVFGEDRIYESIPEMLAALLADEVIFLNSFHWEKDWPEEAREMTSLNVNCNDVFMWACADAERISYKEIPDLYAHWTADPSNGPAIWCIKKRKVMPQKPLENLIRKADIWDFEAMNLDPNPVEEYYRQKAAEKSAKPETDSKET